MTVTLATDTAITTGAVIVCGTLGLVLGFLVLRDWLRSR